MLAILAHHDVRARGAPENIVVMGVHQPTKLSTDKPAWEQYFGDEIISTNHTVLTDTQVKISPQLSNRVSSFSNHVSGNIAEIMTGKEWTTGFHKT